jgi:hypothetical protein
MHADRAPYHACTVFYKYPLRSVGFLSNEAGRSGIDIKICFNAALAAISAIMAPILSPEVHGDIQII